MQSNVRLLYTTSTSMVKLATKMRIIMRLQITINRYIIKIEPDESIL